jgi:hypothetical protein
VVAFQDRSVTPEDAPRQLQPDQQPRLDHVDDTRPADRPGTPEQPARWSRAELRQRLERFPPGHPSSLRSADQNPSAPDLRPESEPDKVGRSFWSEIPRFMPALADHLRRWPDGRETAKVDRSGDPDGSWRGDGNQYLNPEQHAQAKDVIADVQQAERNLTNDMKATARENTCGGWLAGLEHRLKGEERLKEKIAEKIEHEPGKTPARVMQQISDAIRYTFCFESPSYSDGYRGVVDRLNTLGCQMIYSKNHWRDDPEYKGINTRWVTPEGQRYEVQFHTAESFHAKEQITHQPYEGCAAR